jgi:hypothetical protein
MLLSSRFLRVPVRCFDERKHRWQRRFLCCHLDKRDARPGTRVGIALVVADELLGQDSNIVNRAREKPDMVEAFKASEQLERFERF